MRLLLIATEIFELIWQFFYVLKLLLHIHFTIDNYIYLALVEIEATNEVVELLNTHFMAISWQIISIGTWATALTLINQMIHLRDYCLLVACDCCHFWLFFSFLVVGPIRTILLLCILLGILCILIITACTNGIVRGLR